MFAVHRSQVIRWSIEDELNSFVDIKRHPCYPIYAKFPQEPITRCRKLGFPSNHPLSLLQMSLESLSLTPEDEPIFVEIAVVVSLGNSSTFQLPADPPRLLQTFRIFRHQRILEVVHEKDKLKKSFSTLWTSWTSAGQP